MEEETKKSLRGVCEEQRCASIRTASMDFGSFISRSFHHMPKIEKDRREKWADFHEFFFFMFMVQGGHTTARLIKVPLEIPWALLRSPCRMCQFPKVKTKTDPVFMCISLPSCGRGKVKLPLWSESSPGNAPHSLETLVKRVISRTLTISQGRNEDWPGFYELFFHAHGAEEG